MHVGFTGTQKGITESQRFSFGLFMSRIFTPGDWFHVGDCIGADHEASWITYRIGYRIHGHPPVKDEKRCFFPHYTKTDPVATYLQRNARIVDVSDILVACPAGPECLRSGTWSTVRRARTIELPYVIIVPSGTVEKF